MKASHSVNFINFVTLFTYGGVVSRVVRVDEEIYAALARMAADLQKSFGRKVSLMEAIRHLLAAKEKGVGDIMELAGAWKISGREAAGIKKAIERSRSAWRSSA